MSFCITALVTIRYQWVRIASLERLLIPLAENRNPALTGTLVLPAIRYDSSDSSFVEVVFGNAAAEFEGTIVVPKTEVLAILKTASPEDLARTGLLKNRMHEHIEAKAEAADPTTVAVAN